MVKGVFGMLIGELTKRSGLTRDTIRFYEKESLIGADKKSRVGIPSNTYKNYPESTVATLTFIQRTKILGFTLGEIREMLKLREPGQKASKKWAANAVAKLLTVERKIEELQSLKQLLGEALVRCSDQCFDGGCKVLDGAVAKKTGSGPGPIPDHGNANQGNCCS
jgi:DNA-binding transcriptional MerR regulator